MTLLKRTASHRKSNKGFIIKLLFFVTLSCFCYVANAACQSCLLAPVHHHHHRQCSAPAMWGHIGSAIQQSTRISDWKRLAIHGISAQKPALTRTAVGVAAFVVVPVAVASSRRRLWVTTSSSKSDEENSKEDANGEDEQTKPETQQPNNKKEMENPVSTGMISALGFYKGFISPLLPPACRFVPTCSQYGVQAIQEFGPGKGSILIAWRLVRCSPFGGKGFDPPQWPPVSYTYGSW